MAGMGNYLCCEALHVAGIHPQQRPADLSASQLLQLTDSCGTAETCFVRYDNETGKAIIATMASRKHIISSTRLRDWLKTSVTTASG